MLGGLPGVRKDALQVRVEVEVGVGGEIRGQGAELRLLRLQGRPGVRRPLFAPAVRLVMPTDLARAQRAHIFILCAVEGDVELVGRVPADHGMARVERSVILSGRLEIAPTISKLGDGGMDGPGGLRWLRDAGGRSL